MDSNRQAATPTPATGQAPGTIEVTVLFTAFIAVTYGFGLYLFAALMPDMRRAIGFDYASVGFMMGGVQAGFLVFALLIGLLAEKIGMQKTVMLSVFLTAACLLLMPWASSVSALAVLLALMGAAAASVWVPMVAVTKGLVSQAHLGKALGLMSSGTAYGIFINGVVLQAVLPRYGWQSVWWLLGSLAMALALWAALRLGWRDPVAQDGPEVKPPSPPSSGASWRGRLSTWTVFKKPGTLAILLMMFLNGLSCMPVQNYLAALMREQLGYSIGQAATILGLSGVVGMFSGLAMGALADRISIKRAMVVAYGVLSVAAVCFLVHTNPAVMALGAFAFGIAFYAVFGLVPAYVGVLYSAREATQVFGIANVVLGIGGMLGNYLGGMTRQASGSFETVFLMVLVAALATLALSVTVRNERQPAKR
jgi:predicted MFS family arabinose efflux permease